MERRAARLDEKSFDKFAEYQTQQLNMAGAVAVLGLLIAAIIAVTGGPIWGLAAVVAELAALVGVFAYGQRCSKADNAANKTQELQQRQQDEDSGPTAA